MFVTLQSPKMGKLCLVYPSKILFFRLIHTQATYPSAVEMWFSRENL